MDTITRNYDTNSFQNAASVDRTIFLPLTAEEREIIRHRASLADRSMEDFIISAGCYNPMLLMKIHLRDFGHVCENCMSNFKNIKNRYATRMLEQEFFNLLSYVHSLTPVLYRDGTPELFDGIHMNQSAVLAANERTVVEPVQITLPTETLEELIGYAELMQTDLQSYLLYFATRYVRAVPTASFESAFFYLRNIVHLITFVDDFKLQEFFMNNISMLWHMLCDAMIALDTHQYQPMYAMSFSCEDYWVPYEGTSLLHVIGSEEIA